LLFADFRTNTYVLGKSARRTNLCHIAQLS
jgi:hypothetical protein